MFNKLTKFLIMLLAVNIFSSHAGVLIGGTRVVYDGAKKEATISARNPDGKPYLIQSWIDPENSADKQPVPFIVTPPLFRLDAEGANTLRIVRTGHLPETKESVYWLNIKAIPASSPDAKNELHISVNTRIKLFYRPAGLNANDGAEAYKKLTFSHQGNEIQANNPTPFYVSLSDLKIGNSAIASPGMIAPMSSKRWTVAAPSSRQVSWQAINDYGGKTALMNVSL